MILNLGVIRLGMVNMVEEEGKEVGSINKEDLVVFGITSSVLG